jgi:negative regulator of sigma-B (phosphoserine phosphatase)
MELQKSMEEQQHSSLIEWAQAKQEKPQPPHKTEIPVVKATPSGILVGLIDGVGQGQGAEEAAQLAATTLQEFTHQSLSELFARCERACGGTKGVAISAAIVNPGVNTISWFGAGHVQGVLFKRSPAAEPRLHKLDRFNGLVGTGQIRLREMCVHIKPGDLLIFASEGVSDTFVEALPIDGKPRLVADQLLAKYCQEDTDCSIVVVRYLGHGQV